MGTTLTEPSSVEKGASWRREGNVSCVLLEEEIRGEQSPSFPNKREDLGEKGVPPLGGKASLEQEGLLPSWAAGSKPPPPPPAFQTAACTNGGKEGGGRRRKGGDGQLLSIAGAGSGYCSAPGSPGRVLGMPQRELLGGAWIREEGGGEGCCMGRGERSAALGARVGKGPSQALQIPSSSCIKIGDGASPITWGEEDVLLGLGSLKKGGKGAASPNSGLRSVSKELVGESGRTPPFWACWRVFPPLMRSEP